MNPNPAGQLRPRHRLIPLKLPLDHPPLITPKPHTICHPGTSTGLLSRDSTPTIMAGTVQRPVEPGDPMAAAGHPPWLRKAQAEALDNTPIGVRGIDSRQLTQQA
jgi:hypothetical protein